MRRILVLSLVFVFLSSCAPSAEQIKLAVVGTLAAIPTYTPYPTYTPQEPTYTPGPTQTPVIIVVIATYPPPDSAPPTQAPAAPEIILEPTFAPAATAPAPTQAPEIPGTRTADKGPGIYLVGIDIAPGVWRNNGTSDNCLWRRQDRKGELIKMFWGQGGGTIYIDPTDFQVDLQKDCGTWTYLGPP